MPSILDALDWHDLGETPTYARREYQFVPGPGRDDHRCGTLTIRLARGRRAGSVWDEDRYGVQETDCYHGRAFLLKNDDDDQPDVYLTTIAGAGPAHDSCTCTAGNCRLGCKHRDAMRDAIENGLL